MKFYQTVLDNGLTIVGEKRNNAACVAVGFFVKTGARDETPEVAGVSHFLEHMLFKGTDTRSALDITYQLGAIGAQSNAYTNEENTVYYVYLLPEYFKEGFEILSDMMRPALDQKEFDTEKNVILEEIALYDDKPMFKVYESAMIEYFKGHTAGNSVLGTKESISALTRDQMKAYFDKRYSPSNITLSVGGAFDWDEVVDLANKYCGHWNKVDSSRALVDHKPSVSEKLMKKDDLQMAHVCLVSEGPSAKDDLRYAGYVLSCILGDSTGSKAYWELIDKGIADGVSVDVDDMDGTGITYAYATGSPDKIDKITEILEKILADADSYSDDDLSRAKTKIATRLVLQGESSPRRMMAIGNEWTYRQRYSSLDEEMKRFQAVSRKDISTFLKKFPLKTKTKVKMLPST